MEERGGANEHIGSLRSLRDALENVGRLDGSGRDDGGGGGVGGGGGKTL